MKAILASGFFVFVAFSALAVWKIEPYESIDGQTPIELPWEEMMAGSQSFNGLKPEEVESRFLQVKSHFLQGKSKLLIVREQEQYIGHGFFFDQSDGNRRIGMLGMLSQLGPEKRMSVLTAYLNFVQNYQSDAPKNIICGTHPDHIAKMQPLLDHFGFVTHTAGPELLQELSARYDNEDFSAHKWHIKIPKP